MLHFGTPSDITTLTMTTLWAWFFVSLDRSELLTVLMLDHLLVLSCLLVSTLLVSPLGWELNCGRGRGWESRPLSRFCFALVSKGFGLELGPLREPLRGYCPNGTDHTPNLLFLRSKVQNPAKKRKKRGCSSLQNPKMLGKGGKTFPPENYTPRQKIFTKRICPVRLLCNFWWRLRQNDVITQNLIPQWILCLLDGCWDNRIFNVELRGIYVTPEKIIVVEFKCGIDYAELLQWPQKSSRVLIT